MNALEGATIFSTLDLTKGYWQVPLEEGSKSITAFGTSDGLYEFNVLPFGINLASAVFQRMTSEVPFAKVYIDDIIVFSASHQEHVRHLRQVFERLRDASLAVNLKKCSFFKEEISFLGSTIFQGCLSPNSEKINAILNLLKPTSKKDIQEALGLVNFYRNFCPNLADVANPLYEQLKKDVEFPWGSHKEEAWISLKALLTSHPLLRLPNFTSGSSYRPTHLLTRLGLSSVRSTRVENIL